VFPSKYLASSCKSIPSNSPKNSSNFASNPFSLSRMDLISLKLSVSSITSCISNSSSSVVKASMTPGTVRTSASYKTDAYFSKGFLRTKVSSSCVIVSSRSFFKVSTKSPQASSKAFRFLSLSSFNLRFSRISLTSAMRSMACMTSSQSGSAFFKNRILHSSTDRLSSPS